MKNDNDACFLAWLLCIPSIALRYDALRDVEDAVAPLVAGALLATFIAMSRLRAFGAGFAAALDS